MSKEWYMIDNIEEVDSPALVVYPERVQENIKILKTFLPDTDRLRPHIKTNKSPEVSKLLMDAGVKKFKCATIAEAEMLATVGAPDVLLAYQPVGPKADRLIALIKKFPKTIFSCLIDNLEFATHLSELSTKAGIQLPVFIDVNIGMNRTGIIAKNALKLYEECQSLHGLVIKGLHAYDGHLRDPDFKIRKRECNEGFSKAEALQKQIKTKHGKDIIIIAGGTPSFSIHSKRKEVECSPGTFIYWDKGYQEKLTEQPFVFAALVVSRIVSKPTEDTVTVDLGHKSIASENPITNRVYFLNATELEPIGHSEEHLVFKTQKGNSYKVGDVLYGVPYHICPTVALHDKAVIVENNKATGTWSNVARSRKLSV
jgi:D-serine deaminase-like pyridoxal phosphate-dependent protein